MLSIHSGFSRMELLFTAHERLLMLKVYFDDKIIGRNAENFWPPHSPDLNPLDFFFWGKVDACLNADGGYFVHKITTHE